MINSMHFLAGRSVPFLLARWLLLSSCAVLPMGGGASAAEPPIEAITLERDCFGCASGGRLELWPDGQIRLTVLGHARHGTRDQVSTGQVTQAEFTRLAGLLEQQGFFALQDSYDDAQLRDGDWTQISVRRAGQDKQVFRRGELGPPALGVIVAALDALRAGADLRPCLAAP